MTKSDPKMDAIVIGGGFYGVAIAVYLVRVRGLKRVMLVEREDRLLARASYTNQARVHNGYHYPRSFTTAYRSRVNLPQFVKEWPQAIKCDFTKLYAIARRNSKVTPRQFERFCAEIGATLIPADQTHSGLFDPRLIEKVYQVHEYAFDTTELADWGAEQLDQCDIFVQLRSRVTEIYEEKSNRLRVVLTDPWNVQCEYSSSLVFNCTYSGLNQIHGDFHGTVTKLKHEVTEMALLQMPPELESIGVTVMDGPFFSTMPFPAKRLHTLSHVRYTPHTTWDDARNLDPYELLQSYERDSRVGRMVRDAARYMPAISDAKYAESLFEVKTILTRNESDDGRPILFERHERLRGCYSVLGGKIDNIYDVLERLNVEKFNL